MDKNSLSPFRVPAKASKVPTGTGFSNYEWLQKSFPQRTPVRVTALELARHNSDGDVWMAIQGKVYDISEYISYHPGGKYQILRGKGIDATELFFKVHPCKYYNIKTRGQSGCSFEEMLGWISGSRSAMIFISKFLIF
jgi:cytochrome b involved in lipid metabolism